MEIEEEQSLMFKFNNIEEKIMFLHIVERGIFSLSKERKLDLSVADFIRDLENKFNFQPVILKTIKRNDKYYEPYKKKE